MKQPGVYLYDHIRSQPEWAAELLRDSDPVQEAARRLSGASRIFVVGTGTSFHGALVGEYLLRSVGRDARAMTAFEFSQYPPDLQPSDGFVMLSHRGSKNFTRRSLAHVAARSNRWVAITGQESALEGEGVLQTVPQERSPVITVSHLGAMIRLVQLALSLAGPRTPDWGGSVSSLPDAVQAGVELELSALEVASCLDPTRTIFFVAAGPGSANAQEGALKVREAAYISTIAYDVEAVLHGPFISIDRRDSVIIIAEPGPSLERAALTQ